MAELKPCPFCGSNDVGIGNKLPEFGEELTHYVVCNKCGSKTANFRNKQTGVNVWESRAKNNAPTVDAVEVVHGRWIEKIDMVSSYLSGCEEVFAECSVCHAAEISGSSYCPNCGAKMDGGNEDG